MARWLAAALGLAACHFSADFSGTNYRCDDGACPAGYSCVADTCVLPGAGDAAIDTSPIDAADLPWWNSSFGKRANLTITDVSADPLAAGFSIGVAIDLVTLDSPSASWDALRVVRWDAATSTWTELTRYLEQPTTMNIIWFDLHDALAAGASNNDYWLYFDNPAPSAAPANGGVVFPFYDAFANTSIDSTKWVVQGTPTESNNNLTLNPNDTIRSKLQFASGYTVMMSMTGMPNEPRFWGGFQRQIDFTDTDPWLVWINRATGDTEGPPTIDPTTIYPESYFTALGMTHPDWGPTEPLDGAKHYYAVQRLSDRVVFKYDEQVVYTFVLPSSDTDTMQVRLANEGGAALVFGSVHVRAGVWPDPTVTIGATEVP